MNLVVAFLEDRRLGLGGIGGLAIVVGSALPWLTVPQPLLGDATGYGLQDQGKITVVLGVGGILLLAAFARLRQRDLAMAAGAAGLVAAGLAAWYAVDSETNAARVLARMLSGGTAPIDPSSVTIFPARVGIGVWIVIAGAALLVGAATALTLRGAGTRAPETRSSSTP